MIIVRPELVTSKIKGKISNTTEITKQVFTEHLLCASYCSRIFFFLKGKQEGKDKTMKERSKSTLHAIIW